MQCGIQNWILEQKKDINGKSGKIRIKFVVFLVLFIVPQLFKMLTLDEFG